MRGCSCGRILEAEPRLLLTQAAALTTRLRHDDATVRTLVVRALPQLGQGPLVAASKELVDHLVDPSGEVRSAVVGVLASLPIAVLANLTQRAVERLQQQGDAELSYAAVTSWGDLLSEWPREMAVLGGLQFSLGRLGREWVQQGSNDHGASK